MTDQNIYKLMYANFVRYEVLTDLLNATYVSNNVSLMQHYKSMKHIDIYIDIQSLYGNIINSDIFPGYAKIISINILNMAAHYRHYFRKMFGVAVDVYLINNTNTNCNIASEVNTTDKLFKIVEVICGYLPTVFYVNKNIDACINIANISVDIAKNNNSSFIVSRNVLSYQLPQLNNNRFVLRAGKCPRIITTNNALRLWSKSKVNASDINSGLLPLVMAMNKCPELGLPTIMNFSTVIRTIRTAIANNVILNSYNTPSNMYVTNGLITEEIFHRWVMCDMIHMLLAYSSSPNTLYDAATWKIKKHCDFGAISRVIDERINNDPENILNYVYLVE